MKKLFALLAATAAVSLAVSAHAASESAEVKSKMEYKRDGGYEASRSSEQTTPSGTDISSESKVDVDVDSDGLVSKTIKSESKTDPKGFGNRKVDNSKTVFEEKDRGGYKQTTVRTHKDADGTNVKFETITDVDVDSAGNVTTSAKTEKTVDPKGLFNSKTTTSKVKTVNGKVVDSVKKTN